MTSGSFFINSFYLILLLSQYFLHDLYRSGNFCDIFLSDLTEISQCSSKLFGELTDR